MYITQIVQDINNAVHRAIAEGLHLLDEDDLIERADSVLANLPLVNGTQPTTALLLRRYHSQLHAELCVGHQPRVRVETVEAELRELTRAVVVTMGGDEGLSVEGATLLALVLHTRGLVKFCALSATGQRMM